MGDRRDEDTIELAEEAARVFDEIIIRQDKHLRGRTEDAIIALLTTGIRNIDPNKKITVMKKESEAIDYAIRNAEKGSFIVIINDVVLAALDQLQRLKEAEDNGSPIRVDSMMDWVI